MINITQELIEKRRLAPRKPGWHVNSHVFSIRPIAASMMGLSDGDKLEFFFDGDKTFFIKKSATGIPVRKGKSGLHIYLTAFCRRVLSLYDASSVSGFIGKPDAEGRYPLIAEKK